MIYSITSVQPIECLLSQCHGPTTAKPFRHHIDFPAKTVLKKILDLVATPLATFDPPIRTHSLRQAHSHKDSTTNSIWDGGTLRVPFPSDIQRHHDEGERILEKVWLVSPR
ncbi:hypothetical protein TNCV_96481 [Trichonephila clavipes]|nr:hypothetical protein TNCV_96481 [Trichonephila clavipes]